MTNTTTPARLLMAAALAALVAGCSADPAPPPPPKVSSEPGVISFAAGSADLDSLEIVTATEDALPVSADLNARLAVDEAVTGRVGAPLAARVTALLADVGDRVRAGQPLARVDAPDLAQASADVAEAETTASLKGRAAARARDLFAGGAIAERDRDAAESEARLSSAELARARQRLASLGGGGTGTALALTAPVGGVVLDRQVQPGQQLTAGQGPLFTVTDPSRLWLFIDVPESAIGRLHMGQKVSFTVDAFGERIFTATVEKIGFTVDPATRRVQVRARVENKDLALKPEMFAKAQLVSDDGQTAVRVPNAALFERGLAIHAFRQEGPGRFHRVPVTVAVRGETMSWVTSGLKAGDKVVGTGALLLNAQLGDQ
ncbi:MAG: efflux RND transporter periplasmic adaptor subunit [Sphingomonadales bacterium]|jgi:cobalt-zinc-cadmium efflux system membrane fusion protein